MILFFTNLSKVFKNLRVKNILYNIFSRNKKENKAYIFLQSLKTISNEKRKFYIG